MAQMQAPRPMAAPEHARQGGGLQKATNLLGALTSLALVVGVTVWGVQTMMRDVSGVPVIKAAEGPMRITPDDPGGQQARHQGLAVNNVAAEGTAAAPADRLILAPEPLDLTFEEAPRLAASEGEGEPVRAAAEATAAADLAKTDDATGTAQAAAPESGDEAKMRALAEAMSEGVEPIEEIQPAAMRVAEPVEDGLPRSLRPRVRPASLGQAPAQVASAAPDAGGGPRDVEADSIPVGTRLAQLGAFKSEAVAREEWTRLEAKFGDYLDGKSRVIQRATSGGRTFYRLRAMGFGDLADARRFCSALVSERAECIPVVTR